MTVRQVVFDLETTGLLLEKGNRIIEIGAIEMIDRKLTGKKYHQLVNPEREMEKDAAEVHGYQWSDLVEYPVFADVAEELLAFIGGAELVIHNATFDNGFLHAELDKLASEKGHDLRQDYEPWSILDTLVMERELHPGQRLSLDALVARYGVNAVDRTVHGAYKDARVLVDVYLAMTSGQVDMSFDAGEQQSRQYGEYSIQRLSANRPMTPTLAISAEEEQAHRQYCKELQDNSK